MNARVWVLAISLAGCGAEPLPSPSSPAPSPAVEVAGVDHLDLKVLLDIDNQADNQEIIELIDQYRYEALSGVDPDASVRTKLMHMNWYIHTHFESIDVAPFSLLDILKRRHANCTGSSAVMQLMARRMGIPSRTVGIFGIPIQAGHTTAEFMWDNEWHFFDPTFGVFITSDGTINGEILSIDSIMKHRSHIARNTFYANSAGRRGWNYLAAKPATLDRMFTLTQVAMIFGGNYSLFLKTASGATPYENGYVMNTPYYANMASADSFSFGEDDDSGEDVTLHRPVSDIPNDYDGAGLGFIGRWNGNYGPLTSIQSHMISGLKPYETLTITLDAVGQPSTWLNVKVRKGELLSSDFQDTKATFRIQALREDIVFSITDLRQEEPHFTRLDYFEYSKP